MRLTQQLIDEQLLRPENMTGSDLIRWRALGNIGAKIIIRAREELQFGDKLDAIYGGIELADHWKQTLLPLDRRPGIFMLNACTPPCGLQMGHQHEIGAAEICGTSRGPASDTGEGFEVTTCRFVGAHHHQRRGDALASERQGAFPEQFGVAFCFVLHDHDDALDAGNEIHGAPMPLTILPGII